MKVMLKSVIDNMDMPQKQFTTEGANALTKRSFIEHAGFSSIPRDDTLAYVIKDGGNFTCIGTCNKDRPELTDKGDTCLYSDEDKYVKIAADGTITIKNANNTVLLKANGDVEIGTTSLLHLMTSAMITVFNSHTHICSSPGSASNAPLPILVEATHATTKTKAQ